MASRAERFAKRVVGARYGFLLIDLCNLQSQLIDSLNSTIIDHEQKILDLTRCNLTLAEGLMVEIDDPGTIDRDMVFAAVQDWADELARLEEHVL